jgi:hypothetical protein
MNLGAAAETLPHEDPGQSFRHLLGIVTEPLLHASRFGEACHSTRTAIFTREITMKLLRQTLRSMAAMLGASTLLLTACGGGDGLTNSERMRTAFVRMASDASCANVRNHLFVIDNRMVLWDRAGTCADSSYALTLFNAAPEQELCSLRDSVAGPQTRCVNAQYSELFATIAKNLDKPDLGLGSPSRVEILNVPSGASAVGR